MNKQQTTAQWFGVAEHDPIHIKAAEWFVQLQDRNLTLEESLEWQRWTGEDPRHATAFARIEEVWGESWEVLDKRQSYDPNEHPIHRTKKRFSRPLIGLAASLTLGLSVAWLLSNDHPLWLFGKGEVIQTAIGENHAYRLSDGSQVILGGGTKILATLTTKERRIALLQGEAFFIVAKDAIRAFTVQAGKASVTAVGTEFNVNRNSDRITVAVVEGRVIVAPKQLPAPLTWLQDTPLARKPLHLDAGQQTTVDSAGAKPGTALADPSRTTAWQTGQLIFRKQPLRYVIEDVNRYSAKPIVLDDDSIGDIRITGTVLGNSIQGWIESLESAFALKAVNQENQIVLKRTD